MTKSSSCFLGKDSLRLNNAVFTALIVLSALLSAALFTSCPFPIGPDWTRPIEVKTASTGTRSPVLNYDLQAYIPVPMAGAVPVKAIANREDMDIAVAWKDGSGQAMPDSFDAFVLGAVYQADITLTAKTGFSFDPAISFKYPGGAVDAQPADNLAVDKRTLSTVAYKKTAEPIIVTEKDLDLSPHIPAPVGEASPVMSFFAGSYSGITVWETDGLAPTGVFRAGTVYTAKVTLYAAPGYTLAGSVFTYSGDGTLNDPAEWNNNGSTITGILIAFPATSSGPAVPVSDLDITAKLPAPVTGGTPVTYFAAPQYTGTVVWTADGTPVTGLFQAGAVYQATVTLTTTAGYTFTGTSTNALTHSGAATISGGGDTVTVTFPATTAGKVTAVVDDLDMTYKVPVPVKGGTPVTYFSAPQYTGRVDWFVGETPMPHSVFQAGIGYTAKVTLAASSGWTLGGAEAFVHSGTGSTVGGAVDNGNGTVTVTVTFPATTNAAAIPVNDLDMTYKIPSPVRGGTPVTYFSTPQYTGWVDWLVGGTGAPHSVFQPNMTYTAKVTMTAASGYTFGEPAASFVHTGSSSVTTTGGTAVTVTIIFSATNDTAAVLVSDMELTYRVPAPMNGGTPVTYFSAPQYTGNVAWTADGQALGGLFGANTAYTAVVTLTAASGYTFTGMAGTFTHEGANLITHINGNTVNIRFPATTNAAALPVTDLDITEKVPAPVRGGTPVTYFFAPQYTGNVAWTVTAGGHTLSGLFEAGTAYTATVTLTAVSGYTFDGVAANAFIYDHIATLSNNAGSGVVSLGFTATESNQTTAISSVDLSSVLLAPIAFVPAVTVINTGTYSGTVFWTTGAGNGPVQAFETGTVYRATVTLYPAAGYSFPAGLPVTHTGSSGGIAAFTGEPRQGTITFPVTGTFTNFSGPFSGSSLDPADSVVDLIKATNEAEHPFLYIQLSARVKEEVDLYGDITTAEGLVLQHTGTSSDTSPPGVTIDGGKRTIELKQAGSLITVKAGVTLTLRNITIIGASTNTDPLVNAVDGGRVIYETGVSTFNKKILPLSNSKTKTGSGIDEIRDAFGSAPSTPLTITLDSGTEVVSLDDTADIGTGLILDNSNSPAKVTINGSGRTIQLDGNTDGSIITVGAGVTLTLENITFKGSASNNKALITVNGGKLVLEDGAVITGNKSTSGGGVYVNTGTFTMSGGTISGNTATVGGGVYMSGTFTMTGGTISGNTATEGSGVYVDGGTFTMSNGTISNNTPTSGGGGVYVYTGTFTMSGGTISGNTATTGGGVYVYTGTFTMSGGTISGNTAGRDAGGVYVRNSGFTKTTGTIYGSNAEASLKNTAGSGNGHAVYVNSGSKKRNFTAGTGDNLDSTKNGAEGGWE